jgi:DNA-binding transcriptional LysR family regulator
MMMLEKMLTQEKVVLSTVLRLNSIESIKKCVMAGAGITVLSKIAVEDEIAAGSLAKLSWGEGTIQANLLMIWQKEKWMTPILEAFIKISREMPVPD